MAVSESSKQLVRIREAVAELEAAEGRAANHCATCGAAKTLAVESAKSQIVYLARLLYSANETP